MRTGGLAALLIALLAGCVPAAEKSQAAAAAASFAAAVSRKDGSAACALLITSTRQSLESGSGQSCSEAVLEVDESPRAPQVQVWGDEAHARLGADTLFLDHTRVGWRIRAAGCTPQPSGRPYDCKVEP